MCSAFGKAVLNLISVSGTFSFKRHYAIFQSAWKIVGNPSLPKAVCYPSPHNRLYLKNNDQGNLRRSWSSGEETQCAMVQAQGVGVRPRPAGSAGWASRHQGHGFFGQTSSRASSNFPARLRRVVGKNSELLLKGVCLSIYLSVSIPAYVPLLSYLYYCVSFSSLPAQVFLNKSRSLLNFFQGFHAHSFLTMLKLWWNRNIYMRIFPTPIRNF